ncbi:MAG: iron uptake porin [Gloeomargarita sp. SKYBB_i_bin120]|nr:iron uptake porin [Gloeomargarita sp. SKYG98]MCS7291487.1 iron uptake porin [Gloeomargarita sp. SKYB120]MDW8177047.1 iron uptake porin [Gloeomargarita sp. SKYBB_i_bin120]
MRDTLLKVFQVTPAALGVVAALGGVAQAQQVPSANSVNPTLQRTEQYYVGPSTINQAQVTSVSEFVDVKPTDWAFQALQSLVERYGCIVGLPTKPPTYQGRRATTRFEFAAGLNACLDRINELIAASVENLVTKEDLLVIQRLQEEFAAELSVIRGRVDAIEARTALLEQQQFSTVTKLRGEVIFAPYGVADSNVAYNRIENELLRGGRRFTGATGTGGDTVARGAVRAVRPTGDNPALIGERARTADSLAFGYRVRLNFDTSFNGRDRLRVRLQAGDAANLAGATGTNEGRLSFDIVTGGGFQVDHLSYDFTFDRDRGRVTIAGANYEFNDYFDTYNPLASDALGSISRFGRFNPLFYRSGDNSGTGAFIGYRFNPIFRVDAGYLARNPALGFGGSPSAANPELGLFGSNYTVGVLFGVEPTRDFKFGIGYTHAYNETVSRDGGATAQGISLTGATGTDFAINPFNPAGTPGLAPGLAPIRTAVNLDTINLMFQWRALPQFTLAGWFGYGWARGQSDSPPPPNVPGGRGQGTRRANLLTAALVFAFPDIFGRRGDLAGVIVGIPPYVVSSDWFGNTTTGPVAGVFGANVPAGALPPFAPARRIRLQDRDVPVHLEALYRFQVNKYLTVTPGAFVVFNPNGDSRNDPIVVYTIRTTFTF